MSPFLDGSRSHDYSTDSNLNETSQADDGSSFFDESPTNLDSHAAADDIRNVERCNVNGSQELTQSIHLDKTSPIAIVGMSCRFPGDATNPERLWEMCLQGRNAWSEIPSEKFNLNAFYHPDPERKGTMNVRGGYFLKEDVSMFDASFFSISPNEAKAMDPQQRLQLEVTYEALENAGLPIDKVAGSSTSVYVGVFNRDFAEMLYRDPENLPVYQATGAGQAMLSNRISYFFNLKGPSITVDTACSSSLVALHLACQSLRTGESKQAIVGGTNVIMSPDIMIGMSPLRFFSPDGKSYAFDHRAAGYARGEGVASLVLKPLEDALRDGDPIRAVIRESVVNQDGRTAGITLPSREAQENLIRLAYAKSGLDPRDTGYVEAHGTGTRAGDPLEAGALSTVLGQGRPTGKPLYIGSVKTNIGHLEGTSGLAGIIKAVLTLERGVILPSLNFEKPNERIPLDELNLKIPKDPEPWPSDIIRRVAVNSFGYGGTNAHVIMDDANHYLASHGLLYSHDTITSPLAALEETMDSLDKRKRVYIFSAYDKDTGKKMVMSTLNYLKVHQKLDQQTLADDLAFTLAERRSMLSWRAAIPTSSVTDLAESLEAGKVEFTRSERTPRIGFVFTGQGAQWPGMGRELFNIYLGFRQTFLKADRYLQKLQVPWSLKEELFRDPESSKVENAWISQPLCTAIQIALVDLLSSWGVRPVAVTGHSSGEIAAAYAAGALTIESAMMTAYHRGVLSSSIKDRTSVPGAMMAVGLSREDAEHRISAVASGRLVVACVNSPSSVTVSGDIEAINELQARLEVDKIFARKLKVQVAYHSHHMQTIASDYLKVLEHLETGQSNGIRFYSSVTGDLVGNHDLTGDYWVKNMISPVLFSDSLRNMCLEPSKPGRRRARALKTAVDVLIEVGPHSALAGPIRQTLVSMDLEQSQVFYSSCLIRDRDATETALELASSLFVRGFSIDMTAVNFPEEGIARKVLVDLPPYPWNHKSYWHESRLSLDYRFRQFPRHDLLGVPVSDFNVLEPRWRNIIRISELPWLRDHQIQNNILYPAAGMIVMAIEAMRQQAGANVDSITGFRLREVSIGKALIVPDTPEGVETIFTLRPYNTSSIESSDIWQEFRLFSISKQEGWNEHCRGCISISNDTERGEVNTAPETTHSENLLKQLFDARAAICTQLVPVKQMYEGFETSGLRFGPTFQNFEHILRGSNEVLGVISVPDTARTMPYEFEHPHLLHPATLDAVFQAVLPALAKNGTDLRNPMVPYFIKHMYISSKICSAPGSKLRVCSSVFSRGVRENEASVTVVKDTESDITNSIDVSGLRSTNLLNDIPVEETSTPRKLCFKLLWDIDVDFITANDAKALFTEHGHEPAESAIISNLEEAAFFYVRNALATLTEADVQSLEPHHLSLYNWMRVQDELARKGELGDKNSRWLDTSEQEMQQVFERARLSGVEGQMVSRIGENLARVMRREVEPLSLMLENDLLYALYRHGMGMDRSYEHMISYIDKLAHKRPNLNILEIGAGTGGASLPVLQVLGGANGKYPRFAHYDFTDISGGFFEKAQENFKAWGPLLSFKKLNIEEDLGEQGFEHHKYDLIIAANVLHATRSLSHTMQNVRKLLKPGGKLVLLEATHNRLRHCVMFGTIPSWWLGAHEGRTLGPMLSEEEWNVLLHNSGFSHLDVCLHDYPGESDRAHTVMVSSASTSAPLEVEYPEVIIVRGDTPAEVSLDRLHTYLKDLSGVMPELSSMDAAPPDCTGKVCVFLGELSQPILHNPQRAQFKYIQQVLSSAKGVLWVSRGGQVDTEVPEAGLITGLARAVRSEKNALKFVTLDLDYVTPLSDEDTAKTILRVFQAAFQDMSIVQGCDLEYSERNGKLLIPRIVEDEHMNGVIAMDTRPPLPEIRPFNQPGPLMCEFEIPGLLHSLRFVHDPVVAQPLGDDEVEIEMKASGFNFRDIMIALGQLVGDDVVGVECSGVITRVGSNVTHLAAGNRVCAYAEGSFRNYVRADGALVQRLPDDMPFEVAASIPVIYCTAYYALVDTARLEKGETILIHAAAGGVGQAAIMLSKLIGAEIFVTVGSAEKKKFLIDTYAISEDHIFDSRNTLFAQGISRMTKNKGVDVVLNCLGGEALRESWNCTATLGRFVEIGKRDIEINSRLEMAPFRRNVTFASVLLDVVCKHKKSLGSRLLSDVMALLSQKLIAPVQPITTFPASEIETAFRLMQAGKHIGKLVLKPEVDDMVRVVPPTASAMKLHDDAAYLLVGGLGGLGRALARWLVKNGAKHLIFLSRSGSTKEEARKLVTDLQAAGTNVAVYTCDVGDPEQLAEALRRTAQDMPPIRGVVHGGMILKDLIFEKMSYESWQDVLRPKVQGTKNLYNNLSHIALDFFIILSSAAGIVGNTSQSNYAASSTFQDSFARHLSSRGFPVVTLDLGMILSVGFVAENDSVVANLKKWGFLGIRNEEFLAMLKSSIVEPRRNQNDCQVITGLGTPSMFKSNLADDEELPFHFQDPKFSHLLQLDKGLQADDKAQDSRVGLQHMLKGAESIGDAQQLLCQAIMAKMSTLLKVPLEDLNSNSPMAAYGVDSLVAVELRNWIFRDAKADIPVLELLANKSLLTLSGEIAKRSKLLGALLEAEAKAEANLNV